MNEEGVVSRRKSRARRSQVFHSEKEGREIVKNYL